MRAPGKQPRQPRSGRRGETAYQTASGMLVMLEESHELPLVDIQIALRTGSAHDPEGKEGLTRLTGRMIRMGTARIDGNEVEDRIARLGASLSVETTPSYVRFHGVVIKRNVQPFVALLAELLREPAFRSADLSHVKRETVSDIVSARDNDRALAVRHFRRFLFEDHPYGRSVVGTRSSVRSIRRSDVVAHHEAHYRARNLIIGAAGDLHRDELERLLEQELGDVPRGKAPAYKVPAPKMHKGRHVSIVDKPERTQTQLFVGQLGCKARDPDLFPMIVANTAFGGTFTSRLMNEVRSKRGWSYGAYSRLGHDRQRDAWFMWTFPAAKDAVACLELELELLEAFVDKGISDKELRFAKNFLANSRCFEVDTAAKRLDNRLECELYGLPEDTWRRYVKNVRGVRLADAREAVKRRLSTRNLAAVLVATAKDVRKQLEQVPGVQSVDTVRYDRD